MAQAFVSGWVARFEVPSTVATDRGRQFECHLWQELGKILGTRQIRTTAYHPISNGIIERFHRQLQNSLKAKTSDTTWVNALPLILVRLRSAFKPGL